MMPKFEEVVLVNTLDSEVGVMEKLAAHQQGLLHRAFSVFIFNSKDELLIHQRAKEKYHSGGLWTNTCCSHPLPCEATDHAAMRRLEEEMGIHCNLHFAFSFVYKVEFNNGLTEHEFDHVFFGLSDNTPAPNPDEVQNWKYINLENLENEMKNNPDDYTEWLKICFDRMKFFYNQNKNKI